MSTEYLPILIVCLVILVFIAHSIKDTIITYRKEIADSNKHLVVLSEPDFLTTWGGFLDQHFPYYQHLDQEGKAIFCRKVKKLLSRIDIVGKEQSPVTDEMRVLLMSTLAQLTFGLKKFWLYNFNMIHVYPDAFNTIATDGYVHTITYKEKIIALSWKHFETGLLNSKDGYNPGLMTMALALKQTVHNGYSFDTHFASYIDSWFDQIRNIVAKQQNTVNGFINTNPGHKDEFFAACVELFFEQPLRFRELLPDAYAHMCVLLNQNPLNVFKNYQYHRSNFSKTALKTTLPEKVRKIYRHHSWHWSYNLSIFVPICSFVIFYLLLENLLLTKTAFWLLLVSGSVLTTILLYRYNKRMELYSNIFWLFLFCLLTFTPLILMAGISLNNTIVIGNKVKSMHRVSDYQFIMQETRRGGGRYIGAEVSYDDRFLDEYPNARYFDYEQLPTKTFNHYYVEYTIAQGLLGIDVVLSKKLKYNP